MPFSEAKISWSDIYTCTFYIYNSPSFVEQKLFTNYYDNNNARMVQVSSIEKIG